MTYLDRFRRKPAILVSFVFHSAYHNSSDIFSTITRSDFYVWIGRLSQAFPPQERSVRLSPHSAQAILLLVPIHYFSPLQAIFLDGITYFKSAAFQLKLSIEYIHIF